jgi:phosphoribosylcarboxyaminoimidazole (NCAIR) mutase
MPGGIPVGTLAIGEAGAKNAKCAAPPAPAMITLSPRSLAVFAYSNIKSGVRCADRWYSSWDTGNW